MTDDTPTRVLHAAGPIFARKGFEAATVREICTAAGVNLASVNYHFRDKESLYLETVRLAHTLRLQQVPTPAWPPEAAPEQKLRQFIRAMLERMLESRKTGWQTQLLMREMLQPTAACKPLVEDFIRPQLNQLLTILDELLPTDVPSHQRYQIAFSIVGQCLHYRVAREFVALLVPAKERRERYQTAQLAEHIAEFSLASLKSFSGRKTSGKRSTGKRRRVSSTRSLP